ncbi:CapA family protein [Aeromicrobium sp. CF4.19]|uniref:CapA family protein n=1 Tax=Aeromicrobium sp. CF4.19 TaxID=3373082 RepID=UPI003EE44B34
MPGRSRFAGPATLALAALLCAALTESPRPGPGRSPDLLGRADAAPPQDQSAIRLAFAGDVHFEGAYSDVPSDPDGTLGPMSDVLRDADLSMVNLESAVTERGRRTDKELEDRSNRYWFRTEADALDVLGRSGVDVVSLANNHGADYGLAGVRDSIRAGEASDVGVVGIGRNDREAFAPHRARVRDTDIAVHAADSSPRESADALWAAGAGTAPGLAAARGAGTAPLLEAVRESARTDDLVVVYLHWGEEGSACPTTAQQNLSGALERAGADVVVGSHTHTPGGAGTKGDAYVAYGLGNFYWYHGREAETGVLDLTVADGEVVGDEWVPARFREAGGAPRPLRGEDREDAAEDWQELRDCTDLAAGPGPAAEADADTDTGGDAEDAALPAFASSIEGVGPSVQRGMVSHDPATCPVPLADLRHLTVTHVGFDGRAHEGELVMNADVAEEVVEVFATLYEDRFPIERMLLVDEYDGDDDRSMASNNTSGYNCRPVAGTSRWSDHAYGRAIDINPVQNPYVVGGDVRPATAQDSVDVDRSEGADAAPGVIVDGGVARRAFERLGWQWGGLYPDPDYQHFSTSG